MLNNHFPQDDRESYTEVKTTVGNTTVTSYYKVRNKQAREDADTVLDEQFSPPVFGQELVTDTTQWLTASATCFRTLKYLGLVLGTANTLALGALIAIPVIGIFTYQYFRYENDKPGRVLVGWRLLLVILGGLV